MMNLETVKKLLEEQSIATIDLKYADLVGNWYHIAFRSGGSTTS